MKPSPTPSPLLCHPACSLAQTRETVDPKTNSGYLNSSTFGRKESCSTRKSMPQPLCDARSKRIGSAPSNHFDACRDRHWRRVLQKPACVAAKIRQSAEDALPAIAVGPGRSGWRQISIAPEWPTSVIIVFYLCHVASYNSMPASPSVDGSPNIDWRPFFLPRSRARVILDVSLDRAAQHVHASAHPSGADGALEAFLKKILTRTELEHLGVAASTTHYSPLDST